MPPQVMDVGHSLAPNLDIGQIEGAVAQVGRASARCSAATLLGSSASSACVQGLGMTCTEELVYGDAEHPWRARGVLHTQGPGKLCPACCKRLPAPGCRRLQLRDGSALRASLNGKCAGRVVYDPDRPGHPARPARHPAGGPAGLWSAQAAQSGALVQEHGGGAPVPGRQRLLRSQAGAPAVGVVLDCSCVSSCGCSLQALTMTSAVQACYAAREAAGVKGWFRLDSPASAERLRIACSDSLTQPFFQPGDVPPISC